jgi:hypothetical protein
MKDRNQMTLPDERLRSLFHTKQFLVDLLDSGKTPRVPKIVRQRAHSLLRHWPDNYHLDRLASCMPDVFAKQLDPLYKLLLTHHRDQDSQSE